MNRQDQIGALKCTLLEREFLGVGRFGAVLAGQFGADWLQLGAIGEGFEVIGLVRQ